MGAMPLPVAMALRMALLLAGTPGATKGAVRLAKGARAWWSGKRIAVIGPTASGKDSFLARLRNREIPQKHARSPLREKIKSFRVKLALSDQQVIEFTCKGVTNVGGEPGLRDAPSGWLAVCKRADVIFYVMTVHDLSNKSYLAGRRVRQDLDWLQATLPHLGRAALVHVLINKIDQRIDNHTDYEVLAKELKQELRAFDRAVKTVLHPYEARYTGATLISMKNKQMYTLGVHDALRAVYAAFHDAPSVEEGA